MDFDREKYEEDYLKREAERKLKMKEKWNHLKHFNVPEDVPNIPNADPEEYKTFYVPKLIEAGAIPKKDLIDGQVYIGNHRRCRAARWNEKENEFEYLRIKFNYAFTDTCNHFEDDDEMALFVPIKLGTEEDYNRANML